MNRGTTILILLVVLAAMGLVMFSHIGGKKNATHVTPATVDQHPGATHQGGFANPLQAPQGDGGGLRPIEPPISSRSSAPPPAPGQDGAPQPVRLTAAADGKPPQPVIVSEQQATGATNNASSEAATPAQEAPETVAAQGSEGLPSPGAPIQAAAPAASKADKIQQAVPTQPPVAPPPANKPASGAPGLTPWATPPQTTASLPAKPQSKAQTTPGSHSLRNINLSFADKGKGMVLQIEADNPFTVNTFMLTGPERLVIDLPGSWKEMRKPGLPQNALIKSVRLGQQPAGPRLVLDLVGPLKGHRVERSGNIARIYIN